MSVAIPCRSLAVVMLLLAATPVLAQPLGTFRWQQQPYCNVVTVAVVQEGGLYRLSGVDDQCGASTGAAVTGLALPNPNGTIGFGLTIVTTPGGTPLHLDASIAFPALSGTWRDSAGATGAWTFTPGASAGGSARPVPRLAFPGGISAAGATVTNVGAPVSATDAATKAYVDASARALQSRPQFRHAYEALITGAATADSFGCMTFGTGVASTLWLDLAMPEGATLTGVRVRYMHQSTASASMTLQTRYVNFSSFSAIDGPVATATSTAALTPRVETLLLAPSQVRSDQTYYLKVTSPPHTGQLAFCGAAPIYTIP